MWNRFIKSGGLALTAWCLPQLVAVIYWIL